MPKRLSLATYVAGTLVVICLAGFIYALSGQKAQAQPQGLMSAPPCQCSPTTPIASMSTTVVHCICGGISCVISEHKEQGKNTNLMQCVK